MPTANEYLLDRSIRHSVYLEQYKAHEVRELVRFLQREIIPDIERRLAYRIEQSSSRAYSRLAPGASGDWQTKRLNNLLDSIRADIAAGMKTSRQRLTKSLKAFGATEAEFQARLLEQAVKPFILFEAGVPSLRLIHSAIISKPFEGELLSGWFNGLGTRVAASVRRSFIGGLAAGDPPERIVRALMGASDGMYVGRGPLGAELRRNVRAIVRTAISHTASHARDLTYAENKDIVKKVQWVSTLDARTSDVCISRDNKVYPEGEGPRPPAHHQCRSTVVPILAGWEDMKKQGFKPLRQARDMRTGLSTKVPEDMTYGQWLKMQSASVQNNVLGATRAKLFRQGRVDINRFFGNDGRRISLDLLRKRERLSKAAIGR